MENKGSAERFEVENNQLKKENKIGSIPNMGIGFLQTNRNKHILYGTE
jgi:hypothetical protein